MSLGKNQFPNPNISISFNNNTNLPEFPPTLSIPSVVLEQNQAPNLSNNDFQSLNEIYISKMIGRSSQSHYYGHNHLLPMRSSQPPIAPIQPPISLNDCYNPAMRKHNSNVPMKLGGFNQTPFSLPKNDQFGYPNGFTHGGSIQTSPMHPNVANQNPWTFSSQLQINPMNSQSNVPTPKSLSMRKRGSKETRVAFCRSFYSHEITKSSSWKLAKGQRKEKKKNPLVSFKDIRSNALHICSICSMSFPTGNALGGHVSSHTKKKKMEAMKKGLLFKPGDSFFEFIDTLSFDDYSSRPVDMSSIASKSRAFANEEIGGSDGIFKENEDVVN